MATKEEREERQRAALEDIRAWALNRCRAGVAEGPEHWLSELTSDVLGMRGPPAQHESGRVAKAMHEVASAISDERDRLAAQVAELAALAEEASAALGDADDLIRQLDPIDDDDEEGYQELRARIDAAVARIGATP